MKHTRLLFSLVALVGCGDGLDAPRFTSGQTLMVVSSTGVAADLTRIGTDLDSKETLWIKPGTAVRCEKDEEESIVVRSGNDSRDFRSVRVLVLNGPHKGVIGNINHFKLRVDPAE